MNKFGAGGCAALILGLLAVGVVVALVEWIAQHAVPVTLFVLVVVVALVVAVNYGKRLERERAKRRAGASLRVEAARTGVERRLTIAQEFMRLSMQALEAISAESGATIWPAALDDLLAEAELLQSSVLDPQGERLPEPKARDGLDRASLVEAAAALCAFLDQAQGTTPKDWRETPERLRVLRRERTRLLLAQDTIAERLRR